MELNAKFDERVVVHSEAMDWISSPMPGVDRRPLDRVGGEIARATSVVRYAPGSHFSPHTHTGGEEFVVLEGVFQDEHGDFPAGSYVRNPPMSRHTPGSEPGCVIFVKLWQFEPDDREHVVLDMSSMGGPVNSGSAEVVVTKLFSGEHERVSHVSMPAGASYTIAPEAGAEVLVLGGTATEGPDELEKHSWLRSPTNTKLELKAGSEGARIWVKVDNLNQVQDQIKRVLDAA